MGKPGELWQTRAAGLHRSSGGGRCQKSAPRAGQFFAACLLSPCPVAPAQCPEFSATAASLADIEARQDDLLRQLDALEKRIDRVLADYAATVSQSPVARARGGSQPRRHESSLATATLAASLRGPEGSSVVLHFPTACQWH